MADTRAASGLTPQQWDDQHFNEYIQADIFGPLMGEGENAPMQVKTDLTKKPGDSVTFALVNRLTGDATTNDDTLEGNEEDLTSRSQRVYVEERAHAVRVSSYQEQLSAIGLREAARPSLKTWVNEDTRDRIIVEMGSINGVAYTSASEAEKDAWLADNPQTLFGAAVANNSANDHSASLANIDSTNDKLTKRALELLKRRALASINGKPKMRPIKVSEENKRLFIAYVHPFLFRDLRADMESVLDDTTKAGEALRLFEGGDLLWDNIIVKELDDAPIYEDVGNGGIDVAPIYLVGAQAIAHAKCKPWRTVEKDFDYGRKKGIAMMGFDGFAKLRFGTGAGDTDDLKDAGIATGFFSAVAD